MDCYYTSHWMKLAPKFKPTAVIFWLLLFFLCLGGIISSGFPSHIILWTSGTDVKAKVEYWEEAGKGPGSQGRFFKILLSFEDTEGKEQSVVAHDRMSKYPPKEMGICYLKSNPQKFALIKDIWIGLIGTSMSLFVQFLLVIFAYYILRKRLDLFNSCLNFYIQTSPLEERLEEFVQKYPREKERLESEMKAVVKSADEFVYEDIVWEDEKKKEFAEYLKKCHPWISDKSCVTMTGYAQWLCWHDGI